MNLARFDRDAESQRDQQAQLVGSIMAADIQRGIGFGQSAALGLGQHVGEFGPALSHRGQNIVASAVDDPIYGPLPISGQCFTQRPDDRNATADTGFKPDNTGRTWQRS